MRIVILTGSETRHIYFRKKMASDSRIEVLKSYCESDEKSLANRNKQNEQASQLEIQHVEARAQSEIDFFSDYIESSEDKSNPKLISKGAINDEAIVKETKTKNPYTLMAENKVLGGVDKSFQRFVNISSYSAIGIDLAQIADKLLTDDKEDLLNWSAIKSIPPRYKQKERSELNFDF